MPFAFGSLNPGASDSLQPAAGSFNISMRRSLNVNKESLARKRLQEKPFSQRAERVYNIKSQSLKHESMKELSGEQHEQELFPDLY
jgi:hypothetical protein